MRSRKYSFGPILTDSIAALSASLCSSQRPIHPIAPTETGSAATFGCPVKIIKGMPADVVALVGVKANGSPDIHVFKIK